MIPSADEGAAMSSHRGHHASTAGTSVEPPQDWRSEAACLDENPEMWFPISTAPNAAAEALAICYQCPVRQACLADELTRGGMQWGIRGGKTERERRAMLRQKAERRPAYACAVCGAGLPGRPKSGGHQPRYCSDECRGVSKRRRQNEYDARRRGVAA